MINVIPSNSKNYGATRKSKIEYIVLHYTGNDGDTAHNNGIHFQKEIGVSAHYFVDSIEVVQSVNDSKVAWHCGTTGKYKHKNCRNENSIGIEICDDNFDGNIYPSYKTLYNLSELVKYLMEKYDIPLSNVIRHYDVTGKMCPLYWVNDAVFNNFKEEYLMGIDNISIEVDGTNHTVSRIMFNDLNFVKIRDIADILGYDIHYVDRTIKLSKKVNKN